tara:strand:- start:1944 stop:2240 length:297 start_codon:yes stop_codon:yes gene_type:complete
LEALGLTPTKGDGDFSQDVEQILSFYIVLDRSWRKPPTLKSTFSREGAFHIAICASMGFITNCINYESDSYGHQWLITENGMNFKKELDDALRDLIED